MGWLKDLLTPKRVVQPVQLTDENFQREALESELPVLIDFWGPSCPPCKQLEPVIMALAAEYEGRVKVCEMNAHESPKTIARYRVQGTPTVLYVQRGHVAERVVGYRPSSFHRQAIEKVLGVPPKAA